MENDSANDPAPPFASLSSEDAQVLHDIARLMIRDFAGFSCMLGLYGIYFIINGMAFYSIINRQSKKRERSTWILISCLALVFIISTLRAGILTTLNFLQFRRIFVDNPDLPFMQRLASVQTPDFTRLIAVDIMCAVSGGDLGLVFIISDALAVWRATKICNPPKYMARALYFLVFAVLALWATAKYYDLMSLFNGQLPNVIPPGISSLYITGSLLSIAVNLLATGMITFKSYQYRRLLGRSVSSKMPSGKILVFLAESGFIYAVFQIIAFALSFSIEEDGDGPVFFAMSVWQYADQAIAATYTPIIILIITHKMSLADSIEFTSTVQTRSDARNNTHPILSTLMFSNSRRNQFPSGTDTSGLTELELTEVGVDRDVEAQDVKKLDALDLASANSTATV